MMGSISFLAVLIVIAVVAVAIAVALTVAWRRRSSKARAVPVCGGCGYHLAPNPMGLTVCPECGGDFLSVGILAPNMKLGRRGSPAVPLAIVWFILVGVGMVPFHRHLSATYTRQLATNTVTQSSTGSGPFRGVSVNARRDQVAGEKSPDALTAAVTISGQDGKDLVIEVDGLTKTITKAPAATGLTGLAWDRTTTQKIITMTGGGEKPDEESATKMRSVVDDALAQTLGGQLGVFGGRGLITSSSSSSGFSTFKRGSGYIETASMSRFASGSSPVVIIGGLRGAHWVTIITCATGLLLAFGGLWAIVLLTRQGGGGGAVKPSSAT